MFPKAPLSLEDFQASTDRKFCIKLAEKIQ